jgi:3-dehydroquinate synthase
VRRLTVAVDPPYEVIIGDGARSELGALAEDYRRVVIVSQQRLLDLHAAAIPVDLARATDGDEGLWFVLIDDGEGAKSLSTTEYLCRAFASGGLLRDDLVIAFGGGIVGDVAGFAAAVYHRGVAVLQAPTTLLAQVDAAIGGKTAVNLPEGKNLVGAFHQPTAVVADTSLLSTLPDREFRCGLGEVAKYALMPEGDAVASIIERDLDPILARDAEVLAALVAACVDIKADVVARDPEEQTGLRATLNYGHTLAHALEIAAEHSLAHGEAVAIGLVFAANLARNLERVGDEVPTRVVTTLENLGLPTSVSRLDLSADEAVTLMSRDKKSKGGVTFVLPGSRGLERVDNPPRAAVEHALESVGVGA